MFYRNLSDPIPSVRQGAASALCNVVRAYGDEALRNVMNHVIEGLQVNLKIKVLKKKIEILSQFFLLPNLI